MDNLDKFKQYLIEKELSDLTIDVYLSCVKEFLIYFKNKNVQDIHNSDMRRYKEYQLSKNLNGKTVNKKLIAIRQYLDFNEIKATTIRVKTQEQNFLENVITKKEISRIVNVAIKNNDYRTATLFRTMELTGVRISECLSLKKTDINKKEIIIKGKGNKYRTIFIPNKLIEMWNIYCNKYRLDNSEFLFTGREGCITRSYANKLFKKYAKMVGVDKFKAHNHGLRHLYSKTMAERFPIEVVAQLCGHSDINTSMLYLKQDKKTLIDAIEDLE